MNKLAALTLITMLAVSSLILVESASAQSTPKPSVPEFTLKYVVKSYDVPPNIWINPYTGKMETRSPGFSGETRFVEITVKNQPFSPNIFSDGNLIKIYYNVSFKGHYEDLWAHYPDSTYIDLFGASASDQSIISVSLGNYPSIPDYAQLDFRLEAIIGHYDYDQTPSGTSYVTGFSAYETSGWSNRQTITIGQSASTANPNASPPQNSTISTPIQPSQESTALFGLNWNLVAKIVLLSIIAALLIPAVMFLRKKKALQN